MFSIGSVGQSFLAIALILESMVHGSRITFKSLLLTYKALIGDAPSYLKELVIPYCPTRELRSLNAGLLVVPRAGVRNLIDWESHQSKIFLNIFH